MTYTRRFDESGKDDVDLAGGKGANLGELSRAGFPVPPGFVLTTAAYDAFVAANDIGDAIVSLAALPPAAGPGAFEDAAERIRALFSAGEVPAEVAGELRACYAALCEGGKAAVAVRSSATAEDLAGASFAGQQETYLNVRGAAALIGAVQNCWASLWTARAMAYRARHGMDPAGVRLAVVVQRMVESEAAGVMFTVNPANGRRNEVVIGAAWGLGESVVGGAVNTDDLVVDKESGRVLSRETADKQLMTGYAETGTARLPVPQARRSQPVLDDAMAAELARYGARIEAHYAIPQDIEWALAGGEFFIVQSRPITALLEPMTDPPTDWSVPDPKAFYFRASIVEQLPDPLSPLFADLADGSVARSLETLLREFLGSGVLREGDVGLPTVNGYAYYCYKRGAFWRLMLKSPSALRLLTGGREGRGLRRWREYSRPRYAQIVARWEARRLDDLPATELLAGVEELLDAGTEYYTSVQTIIPLAASSEALFTALYDRVVRRAGDPTAPTFLLGFDSMPIRAETSLYDLAMWTRAQGDLAAALASAPSARVLDLLRAQEPPDGVGDGHWLEWRSRFQAHLDRYGHAVYNLDFRNAVPADDPAPLFDTLKFYLRGDGTDPHERQRGSAARREEETLAVYSRLGPARRVVFERLLRWAQSMAPVREDALADMGLAWPLMRRMLLELGQRLAGAGGIDKPADVFWLRRHELQDMAAAVDAGNPPLDRRADAVGQRKMLWRGQRRVTPPQLLPKRTWFKVFEGMMPAASEEQTGDTIKGIGASAGTVTAPARVLAGPEEFGQMQPGEVLVAGITTPAWTTLFAMASAVVTDVGGPLSHSSIVAREYGIPAVLGTAVATRRIRSGQSILVDGSAGTVTLLDGAGEKIAGRPSTAPRRGAAASPTKGKAAGRALAGGAVLAVAAWFRKRRRDRRKSSHASR
jgi:rifampicin phosphotransferase